MITFKHLTMDDRKMIERGLNQRQSFKAMAVAIQKNCTTISKEIRSHLVFRKTGGFGRAHNSCMKRFQCEAHKVCKDPDCKRKRCNFCPLCNKLCLEYLPQTCNLLAKPPYVCNGCKKLSGCTLEKRFYYASEAQTEYESVRRESRTGISATEEDIQQLDSILSPLLKKGQSIHHICVHNADIIMYDQKTIYNYMDANLFSASNLDMPRKVKFRQRKKKRELKVDKACFLGRNYTDFLAFCVQNPDMPTVQMDTVEGDKGGKVLLTLHFTNTSLMLAFLRDCNNSRSVTDIFNTLYKQLGAPLFRKLFPVILTDRGSEFTNPTTLEFDSEGNRRTYIFYCDPQRPDQKSAVENNHTLIRRVVPKGKSFSRFTQVDISLMMNHINSYTREKLNDKSPIDSFSFLYSSRVLAKLDICAIPPNDILLIPELLKK